MNKPKLERCPGPWTAVLMASYGATYYKVVDKNRNNVCCYIADKKTAELIADTWTSRAPLPDNKALTVIRCCECRYSAVDSGTSRMMCARRADIRPDGRIWGGTATTPNHYCGYAYRRPLEKGD